MLVSLRAHTHTRSVYFILASMFVSAKLFLEFNAHFNRETLTGIKGTVQCNFLFLHFILFAMFNVQCMQRKTNEKKATSDKTKSRERNQQSQQHSSSVNALKEARHETSILYVMDFLFTQIPFTIFVHAIRRPKEHRAPERHTQLNSTNIKLIPKREMYSMWIWRYKVLSLSIFQDWKWINVHLLFALYLADQTPIMNNSFSIHLFPFSSQLWFYLLCYRTNIRFISSYFPTTTKKMATKTKEIERWTDKRHSVSWVTKCMATVT